MSENAQQTEELPKANSVARGTDQPIDNDLAHDAKANSQTAADFIRDQLQLEADAREAMPYAFDSCTYTLGPLKQAVFSCLTCNPIPKDSNATYEPAGVCYACSIQCHGDHTLVEIFAKRDFTCDCGTTRLSRESPCTLRVNPTTNTKGVHSEKPFCGSAPNVYNQNFQNRFCSCACDYDPFQQKGTMFQCLGLGTHLTGGCGEDWFHPGCLVGLGPRWFENMAVKKEEGGEVEGEEMNKNAEKVNVDGADAETSDDPPLPPGFPDEESFEGFFCYKCVESNPWIKRYAGSKGFLPAVLNKPGGAVDQAAHANPSASADGASPVEPGGDGKKRKASELDVEPNDGPDKRSKNSADAECKLDRLPGHPSGTFSLFFEEGWRDQLCRCSQCTVRVIKFPQLGEEEEIYEPPISENGSELGAGVGDGGSTHGSGGSIYDRGESALNSIDRVRAIEGVMAYNMMKEKLKPLFESFAGTGQAISADDIKDYFAKLRGDDEAIKRAGQAAAASGGGGDDPGGRREQNGY